MKTHIAILAILISCFFSCKLKKEASITQSSERHGHVNITTSSITDNSSTLKGSIIELQSGEPVIFAHVLLIDQNHTTTGFQSDMDGNFIFTNVKNGKYLIQLRCIEYAPFEFTLEVNGPAWYNIEVKMEQTPVEVLKPIIYLYPTSTSDVSVQINYDGMLTHTYPTYPENGWNVTADPNGTLHDKSGQEYYALFWEGIPKEQLIPYDGFIVPGDETIAFLEEKLAYLGLNRREANEFIMYWLPKMENNPYNFIHFAGADYQKQSELIITPAPETTIRVMMLTQPLQSHIEFPLQDLSMLKNERKGFTVVEWGGSVIQLPNP